MRWVKTSIYFTKELGEVLKILYINGSMPISSEPV